MPRPNASKEERKRIREVTAEQIARTNCNNAQRKLEMLMAANFEPEDLMITATYRDADLPESAEVTRRRLGKVFAQLRAYRKARGLPDLKYIYVLEGRHGDHRPHAHIILNAVGGDLELFKSLWIWGDDVQLSYIRERGYDGWAGYLTRSGGRPASMAKSSSSARGASSNRSPLMNGWTTAQAWMRRLGAQVLDEGGGRNETASCRYIKYLLPRRGRKYKQRARTRVVAGLNAH